MNLKKFFRKSTQAKAAILMVLILSSIESYLWYLEANNMIEDPYYWSDYPLVSYKINKAMELFSEDENKDKIKVVLVGDSILDSGFYSKQFDKYFNDKTITYNLGITGSDVEFQSFFIREIIVPKLKPDILIWAFTLPYDFIDRTSMDDKFLNSTMARYYNNNYDDLSLNKKSDLLFLKISRIYKHRFKFLPQYLKDENKQQEKIKEFDKTYTERGYRKVESSLLRENESMYNIYISDNKDFYYDSSLYTISRELSFQFDSQNIPIFGEYDKNTKKEFLKTIDLLESKKIKNIFVINPQRCFRINFPSFQNIINQLNPKYILDLNGNDLFNNNGLNYDLNHINHRGAKIYTKLISEKVSNLII